MAENQPTSHVLDDELGGNVPSKGVESINKLNDIVLEFLKNPHETTKKINKEQRNIIIANKSQFFENKDAQNELNILVNEKSFEDSVKGVSGIDELINQKGGNLDIKQDTELGKLIQARTGIDIKSSTIDSGSRAHTYLQGAIILNSSDELLIRSGIPSNKIQELRTQAEALGIPKKAPASEYLQPKGIPGLPEQKSEATQAALGSTIPEGKRDSTTVSRVGNTFEWKDPKNPDSGSYFLDVERTPPILTKKRNGLEIQMQLSGNTEKPYKDEKTENKRLDTEKIPLEKTLEGVMSLGTTEGNNNVMPLESDNSNNINQEEKKKIISLEDIANIKLLHSLKLPAQKGFYLQTLAELQKSFTQKKGEINKAIIKLNSQSGEMDILERMDRFSELQPKQELIENIGKTIERLEDVASKYKDIGEDEKSPLEKGIDDFERNSEFNLGYLSRIQYGQLGQKNLDLIIQSINEKNIPEVGQIDPSLNERLTDPQTQKLTLVIANLVRNNTLPDISARSNTDETIKKQDEWKDVSRTDPIIAYNQTQTPTFGEALKSVKTSLDPNIVKTGSDTRSPREIIDDAITGKSPREGPNNSN